MLRIIKNIFIWTILISLCFPQQKIDFRTAEEQAKDPNIALKKSLIFPGVGQLYNDQKIKDFFNATLGSFACSSAVLKSIFC